MRLVKPFLLSGLLAAVVVGGFALYVLSRPPQRPPMSAPTPAPVPTPAPAPVHVTKTYRDETLGFSVAYPEAVVPTEDKQAMAISGYIPVCDPDTAVACFPYGKEQLPGTNFENAAFSVQVLPSLRTEAKCRAVGNGEQADGSAAIDGVAYQKYVFGDAAMGHQLAGQNYRTFRNGHCFQLSTDIFTSTFENYPPGTLERFTDEDRAKVQRVLDDMLSSFTFSHQ